MFNFVHPRKRHTTKNQIWKLPGSFHKSHKFGLALHWVGVCGEFKVVTLGIVFTGCEHILQGAQGWCQEPIVVTISKYAMVIVEDPASSSPLLQ